VTELCAVFQTIANALLYAYTPEVFAGPYRGSASGIASTLGRLSGIAAPRIIAPYYARGSDGGASAHRSLIETLYSHQSSTSVPEEHCWRCCAWRSCPSRPAGATRSKLAFKHIEKGHGSVAG
jgi:hypothetical protein